MAVAVISAISNVFVGYAPKISKSLFENQSFFIAFLVAAIVQLIPAVLCLFLKLEKKNEVENSDKKEAEKTKKRMGMKDYLKGISFAVLPICTLGLFANCTRDLFMTYGNGICKSLCSCVFPCPEESISEQIYGEACGGRVNIVS